MFRIKGDIFKQKSPFHFVIQSPLSQIGLFASLAIIQSHKHKNCTKINDLSQKKGQISRKRTQILTALRCARRSASASSARHASLGNFAYFLLGQIWHRLSPATIHCTLARVFYFRARRPANKSTNRVKRWSTVATHYGGFGDNRLLHFYTITVSLKVFRCGLNWLYQLSDWLIDH